jgi:hypothetical protein
MLIRDINYPKESTIRALYNILRCFGRKKPIQVSLLDCEELVNTEIEFSLGSKYYYLPCLKSLKEVKIWFYQHIKCPIQPIKGDLVYGEPVKNDRSGKGGVLFFVRYNVGKAILTNKINPGWYRIDKDFDTYSTAKYIGEKYPVNLENYIKQITQNSLHPEIV